MQVVLLFGKYFKVKNLTMNNQSLAVNMLKNIIFLNSRVLPSSSHSMHTRAVHESLKNRFHMNMNISSLIFYKSRKLKFLFLFVVRR